MFIIIKIFAIIAFLNGRTQSISQKNVLQLSLFSLNFTKDFKYQKHQIILTSFMEFLIYGIEFYRDFY